MLQQGTLAPGPRASLAGRWAGPRERSLHGSEPRDDVILMAAVAVGSEEALRAVYERYGALVFTAAFRMLGNRQSAEEVTQDVFLRCWKRAAHFDAARGSLPGWLLVIARNGAIDVLRSSRRSIPANPASEQDERAPAMSEAGFAESSTTRIAVTDAMQVLPEPQRRAIELALFGQLTQQEISDLLNVPLGTVKTRIRDGMGKLRRQLVGGDAQEARS